MVTDLEFYFSHYQSLNHGVSAFLPKYYSLHLGFLQVGSGELC